MDYFDDNQEQAKQYEHKKSKRHECLSCFRVFTSQAKLKRHGIVHSTEKKNFHCQFCELNFRLHKELLMHEATHKRTLANINLKRCKICGIACYNDLLQHLKEHHEHFECDICQKIYHSKNHLKLHMKTHINARDFKCSACPKAFNFVSQLKRHERSHSTTFVWCCEICGMGFKNKSNLAYHIRRHNGEKPFQCDRCERCFSAKQSLHLHIRIHDGEKPYKCPWQECGRCFHDLATMKVHTRLHTNESPYKCHLCGKTTKQASNLKSHYLHAHKIDDITSKTIRANSRLFQKYKTENLPETGLLEILSQQVLKNLEEQNVAVNVKREPAISQEESDELSNNRSDGKFMDESVVKSEGMELSCKVSLNNVAVPYASKSAKPYEVSPKHSGTSTFVDVTHIKEEFSATNSLPNGKSPSVKKELVEEDQQICQINFRNHSTTLEDMKLVVDKPSEKFPELNIKKEMETEQVMDEFQIPEPTFPKANTIKLPIRICSATPSAAPSPPKFPKLKAKAPIKEIQNVEPDNKFKCDICPSTFRLKVKLKIHMKTHSTTTTTAANDKCKICEICGKTYTQHSALQKHLKFTHSSFRQYHCEVCGRGFKDSNGLKVHLRSHSGEKPYSCSFCSKSFSTSMGRNLHQRGHTGEKPYKCQYCDSAFSDNSTYRQHIRVHTGEKPYVCHLCGRGTTQAGNLKSHLRHAHNIYMKNVSMKRNKI